MTNDQTVTAKVGGYISNLMREHFGKGPTSVYVVIKPPFVVVHLRGFLAPTERILLEQKETERVLKIRDLLMDELQPKIKLDLWKLTELDILDIYADWNLDNKTGMILGILDEDAAAETLEWPGDISREGVHDAINEASAAVEKSPGTTEVYWLNDRMLLIVRKEILVAIEKELIKSGYAEPLRIAKRPLEKNSLFAGKLATAIDRTIQEVFVDWDFEEDIGYMVVTLESQNA